MIRCLFIGVVVVIGAGCDSSSGPEAPTVSAEPVEAVAPTNDDVSEVSLAELESDMIERVSEIDRLETMHIDGPEMWMYEEMSASATGQKPTFFVQAATADGNASDGWQLASPEATIYGEDSEDVTLIAQSGSFDNDSETASLAGDVQATIGTMAVQLEEIFWDNKNRLAYSDAAVTLKGDQADLDAQSIRIQPKFGTIELENVTGTFELGEM